jgi:hypothetical protein
MRVLVLGLIAACHPSGPPRTGHAIPMASHEPAPVAPARAASGFTLGPAGIDDHACPLSWNELDAPSLIPLLAWGTDLPDDCPELDAAQLLAPGGCVAPDCTTATLDGRPTAFVMEGPAGSGRFASLALVVGGNAPRFACISASTVGWRHLVEVADQLAPLPWFDDVDGDGRTELVAWQRLPWGNSEYDNGMVPIVYALEGDALVRRDELGIALHEKVAAAYRTLAARPDASPCYAVIANALDR